MRKSARPRPVPPGELGYARVSTTRQSPEHQLDALSAQDIPDDRIYAGKKTGATTDCEGLQRVLAYARPGDTVVVRTPGWLGRSLRGVLSLFQDLTERASASARSPARCDQHHR
jgi:DNA invertase Pin-like site-specific DNA recombinase